MESIAYDRFNPSDTEISHTAYAPQWFLFKPGLQNRKMCIIYSILVLYMFILTLAVGIKFSQLSQEVADVSLSLNTIQSSIKETTNFESIKQDLCEENWVFFKGSCYFQSIVPKNWHSAENNCVQQKSHLAVVNDLAELDFLSSILKLSGNYWIGLVEKEKGKWSWVDGTDFESTEHYWDVGQPDDWKAIVNGEDCGQLHARLRAEIRRLWNDGDCTLSYPYICEGKPKSQ